jgi:hypothetical protein
MWHQKSISIHIVKNCTSTIKVEARKDGKVLVDVCYTHYDHKTALQHIWLPNGKCQKITAQLQQGITRERILSDIKEEDTQHKLKRYHLTSKKDLSNIWTLWHFNVKMAHVRPGHPILQCMGWDHWKQANLFDVHLAGRQRAGRQLRAKINDAGSAMSLCVSNLQKFNILSAQSIICHSDGGLIYTYFSLCTVVAAEIYKMLRVVLQKGDPTSF